jgi:hypothetical protein
VSRADRAVALLCDPSAGGGRAARVTIRVQPGALQVLVPA